LKFSEVLPCCTGLFGAGYALARGLGATKPSELGALAAIEEGTLDEATTESSPPDTFKSASNLYGAAMSEAVAGAVGVVAQVGFQQPVVEG
jgi:hypothetical protein